MTEQPRRPDNYDETSPLSAELFHLIVENVKDYAVFMTDANGAVVSWNPGVERLLGYAEREIVGQPIEIIFTPEDRAARAHVIEMETAAAAGRADDKRWHRRKDGSRFWANGMTIALKNANGSLRGFAKIMRDETAQKLAQEKLAASNLRIETILSSIGDAFYTLDRDFRYVYVNKATTEMFGLPESKFLGKTLPELFPAVEGSIFHLEIERALKEQTPKIFENYYPPLDRWFENRVYPTTDGLSIFTSEITARKKAELKLTETNAVLNAINLNTPTLIYVKDRDGRILSANPATCAVIGKPLQEIVGKTHAEYMDDLADGDMILRNDLRIIREGKTETFEEEVLMPDGKHVFLSTKTPYRGEQGEIIGLIGVSVDITARKQSETALRESEEKYRTLFDSIDEGFCIIEVLFDTEGKAGDYRFLEFNPSFEKISGLPAADALAGKTITEMAPDIEPKWFEIYGRIAVTGKAERFVEGSAALNRWFDVYAFRVGAPEERRLAVLFNDITESKTAETKLREAEQRYRALVEATATTVWHADPSGALTFVGDVWTQVTGQSIEDILKWGWLEAIHPDDREPTIENWSGALKNKTLYSTEFRIKTRSGEYRWFAVSAVPILDAGGGVREWIGSNIDITARKRAEEERAETLRQLEAERARLNYLFEQAPAFVATLRGADHVFELTNPAYLQLIGHRNVIGKTVREALPEVDGQGFFELLDRVYQTGEPFTGNALPLEIQREPNGEPEKRFVDFVYQPIFEIDKTVSGIFVHGVDITDQVTARQQAESANRLKDEFLATLSHELRTPLNAILGWSQILLSQNLDAATAKKAIATIERSARAQNQLIEDLLDVSRIITGKLRLDVRAVDLSSVVAAAADAARPAAEAKNIRLQTLLDPQAGPISGDPDRLQQVVWNLLSNAIKFTDKNGRVQVRLERVNSHVEITVSDTGVGIEPEFLPHVFDRFRQSDGSMTRRHGGLGLGLAIVRQLVELHGGTVAVSSAGEGKGATFAVHLPLLPVRTEPAVAAAAAGNAPRTHPKFSDGAPPPGCSPELDGLRVLLVDDEADSRDLLNLVLESCGAQVAMAGSAAEALEIIENESFDVIISDIGMPGEDGFSLIGKIRNLPDDEGGSVPAIALTAYARAEDRVQALRSGFQMHIAKPVEPAELIAIVANLAGRMRKSK